MKKNAKVFDIRGLYGTEDFDGFYTIKELADYIGDVHVYSTISPYESDVDPVMNRLPYMYDSYVGGKLYKWMTTINIDDMSEQELKRLENAIARIGEGKLQKVIKGYKKYFIKYCSNPKNSKKQIESFIDDVFEYFVVERVRVNFCREGFDT